MTKNVSLSGFDFECWIFWIFFALLAIVLVPIVCCCCAGFGIGVAFNSVNDEHQAPQSSRATGVVIRGYIPIQYPLPPPIYQQPEFLPIQNNPVPSAPEYYYQ